MEARDRKWWLVTQPKQSSTVADCVTEVTAFGLGLYAIGSADTFGAEMPSLHATKLEALEELDRRTKAIADKFDALRQKLDAEIQKQAAAGSWHTLGDGTRVFVPGRES